MTTVTDSMSDITPQPAGRADLLGRLITGACLLLILAFGAYFRFVGQDWDEGQHLHPDERFLSLVESAIYPVESLAAYFDTTTSTLNPNNVGYAFYVYGDLPIVVVRYLTELTDTSGYGTAYLTGRTLSAIYDLLSVILIFFTARLLFDRRVGLLAAALYAVAAFPIQQSHFFTVEAFTNLWVVAAFFFIARAYRQHHWLDYPLFGLMLGLGMASKVSIYPLALILIVALGLRVWGEYQTAVLPEGEPAPSLWRHPARPLILRATIGLSIAGLVTILAFRVGQPYAFLPPGSEVPINAEELGGAQVLVSRIADPLGLRPNPLWLDQMDEVRLQVSGYSDIPPNHQWGKRLPLVFPWINTVRVGLGWPLGVFAWLAFAWAVWEIWRRHRGAMELLLPITWTGLFFIWQGIGWVKTMRYFLPIYPFLLMLAGWVLVTIHDRIGTLVESRRAPRWHWSRMISIGLAVFVLGAGLAWGYAVSRIYTRPVTRVAASRWMYEHVPSDVTLFLETAGGTQQVQIGLPNIWLPPEFLQAPPEGTSPDDVAFEPINDPARPELYYTLLSAGLPQPYQFNVPVDGTLSSLRLTHVADRENRSGLKTLRVVIATDLNGTEVVAEGAITSDFPINRAYPHGESYTVVFEPVQLNASQTYYLILEASAAGPLTLSGSVLALESAWDDPLPLPLPPYNTWGAQYQSYLLELHWEDIDVKRERMRYILDHADYLVISSNRFYDSLRRNPQRFPLTLAYYRALFGGDLGFELVADFTSRPNIGLISFKDDRAEEAWTVYDHPRVFIFRKTADYDPARVSALLYDVDVDGAVRTIAKDSKGSPARLKLPDLKSWNQANRAEASSSASPTRRADPPPNLYLSFQLLAVLVWYALVLALGWSVFPLLYALFPGLPDRGFPFARIFALLVVSWLAWLAASLKLLPWSGWLIALAWALTALASALVAYFRRGDLVAWLKDNRRHVLLVEGLTLALFLLFLYVRRGNPDLWHPAYGGEKPMDLSYFNAILKTASFPPYDPWFAGGTINYYYYGFVLVAAPLKLTGIPVTLAYNLILPTLFAMTGTGAFSVAYNLVAHNPVDNPATAQNGPLAPEATSLWETLRAWPGVTWDEVRAALRANLRLDTQSEARAAPLRAGFAALLMTALLGNLDQIRTLLWGLAELGSGQAAYTNTLFPNMGDVLRGLSIFLTQNVALPIGLGEWYWNATRLIPVPLNEVGQPTEIGPITEFPFFTFLYADLHAHLIAMPLALLALIWTTAQIKGAKLRAEEQRSGSWLLVANLAAGSLIIGALRPTNTWDLPTYLLLGAGGLALAHIARRQDEAALRALTVGGGIGALVAGAVYFLVAPVLSLAIIGGGAGFLIGFVLTLNVRQTRARSRGEEEITGDAGAWVTLAEIGLQVAALAGGTILYYLPYVRAYHLGYTTAIPWTGSRTPLWAYLDMLGLLLFVIGSWMVHESLDWYRSARQAGAGINRRNVVPILLGLVIAGVLINSLVTATGSPIAALTLPLIAWAGALLLRRETSFEKRAVLAMLIVALALSMTVEVVVLQGDISRMNTVFKFYLQVWILMALAAGAALAWLWPGLLRARPAIRTLWLTLFSTLVFLAALYPLLATRAKVADRWAPDAPRTLDGMAYMAYATQYENGVAFNLIGDYAALRWLQTHVKGTPVVLEAQTVEYHWGSRVAVYTGLPAVLGWNWHQRQQRPWDSEQVWLRAGDIQVMYNTTDIEHALTLLRQYNVELIYVGELERAYYNAEGLQKFDQMVEMGYLTLLYDQANTRIYQVNHTSRIVE